MDAETQRHRGLNEISGAILGAAIEVHRGLGPGLLESIYEECLFLELQERGLSTQRQVPVPVYYKGRRVAVNYRIDLVVEAAVVVELKAVELVPRVCAAQLLTYLKLTKRRLGLLINFCVPVLHAGVERVANGCPE